MSTLAKNLRAMIALHVESAPQPELLEIVTRLCTVDAANQPIPFPTKAKPAGARFIKVGADGERLQADATDWVAVYDSQHQLTWTRQVLDGEFTWKGAMDAAAKVNLLGSVTWRAPTIQEQLSIIDYSRCDPALDTHYFDGKHGWTWTSTPAAAPAGFAWYVSLYDGDSLRAPQDGKYFVRAVRAGQLFDL